MVNQDYYHAEMTKAFRLLGNESKALESMAKEAYGRIKDNFTNEDLYFALEHILQDGQYLKINFPILLKCLNNARGKRFDQEAQKRREEESKHIAMFWDKEDKRTNCTLHHCGTCDGHERGNMRCDSMANVVFDALREISSFVDREGSASEIIEARRIHNEIIRNHLIKEFPGAGFDKDFSPIMTITREQAQQLSERGLTSVRQLETKKTYRLNGAEQDNDFIPEED